jgi:malate synthase
MRRASIFNKRNLLKTKRLKMPKVKGLEIVPELDKTALNLLTEDALQFLKDLHKTFNPRRLELLEERKKRQERLNIGQIPTFLPETAAIRQNPSWKVAPTPEHLERRWVEITGPTDRKMVINALNSGADVFMADFEDATSPTWNNLIEGQQNLIDANNKTIHLITDEGKEYRLKDSPAKLFVRPRGWHLDEKHIKLNGVELSASLFDFGLYLFHNHKKISHPAFYLPKLESHLEARLWADVFAFSEEALGMAQGVIRATVLIETILAAFEMEEILFELRNYSAGLNAGRWDYIFSIIKKFQNDKELIFPDRDQITMATPFLKSYATLLVHTCHKRGAHAIGGMAAFIPNRKDPKVTEHALKKVVEDKEREVSQGFDGTWVAHPDLVPVAREVFEKKLKTSHQKGVLHPNLEEKSKPLLDFAIKGGKITEEGLRHNLNVALQYLASWLLGRGAAAIYNLMEDAATCEISRSQVWQWLQRSAHLQDGTPITEGLVSELLQDEEKKISSLWGTQYQPEIFSKARTLLEEIIFSKNFVDFLTLPAYKELE